MQRIAFLLLLAAPVAAQQNPHAEIFPSDYKPAECASKDVCESFTDVSFRSAAHAFLLRNLDSKWIDEHAKEMEATAQKYCPKRATCNASPGRVWWFCNDVFAQELRATCDQRFDPKKQTEDNTQCRAWMDTYSAGVDQRGSGDWTKAQQCLRLTTTTTTPSPLHQMDWWSVPAVIPADYKGPIQIFAIDRETHVPVQADIRFENQILYATDPPNGQPTTYYQFKWPRKLVRVQRADGHSDVVPVRMTISAPGYETVSTPTPTEMPAMNVSLERGKKGFVVRATDSLTGQPVEAQIYLGKETVGFTNQPIAKTIAAKHPELWVRSPFDAYSDVVVLQKN